jgi:Tripartite tricarboxylate transporter TctB family
MKKIGNKTDFWGGVMFAAVGFAFLIIAYGVKIGDTVLLQGYSMGTPARMGPAFFPFWLGLILTVLGVAIALAAVRSKVDKPLEKFHWGPVGWVLGAVVIYGFLMKPLGMPVAGFVLVVVASFGGEDFRWKPTVILALALTIFTTLVFAYGLKLPIPLCPDLESLQNVRMCRV